MVIIKAFDRQGSKWRISGAESSINRGSSLSADLGLARGDKDGC